MTAPARRRALRIVDLGTPAGDQWVTASTAGQHRRWLADALRRGERFLVVSGWPLIAFTTGRPEVVARTVARLGARLDVQYIGAEAERLR